MSEHELAVQSLYIAQYSARWARYAVWIYGVSAVIGLVAAMATLWAVLVARKGLSSWKDQHISVAKAEWIASLVNYASGLSSLPDLIDWRNLGDAKHVERIAFLQYECIKCWKVLQVHLSQNPALEKEFHERYDLKWATFVVNSHNAYMNRQMPKEALKKICIDLYNT